MFSRLSTGRIFGDQKNSTSKVTQADPTVVNNHSVASLSNVNESLILHDGATVSDCTASEASGSLVVVRSVVPSAVQEEDDDDEVNVQLMGNDEPKSVEGNNTSSISTVVSAVDVVTTHSTLNVGNYLSKFRDIALMAAKASPATGMMIAGHAQNVAKSVAVAAMSAVDTVEATKTAIMRGQEQRSKVRHSSDPFTSPSWQYCSLACLIDSLISVFLFDC